MPDDATPVMFVAEALARRKVVPLRREPSFRPVSHPQATAGTHDFSPRPSFRPAEVEGAVYWGRVRLGPETVERMLADFQRDAQRYGDWTLFDQLTAARDGIEPEPPTSAA